MKVKGNKVLALALTVIMLIGMLPAMTFAGSNDSYYIKNNYTSSAYMYEANGVLRYGVATVGDSHFQWEIEQKGSCKIIKNVATNHYITLEGHAEDTVEGYWGDEVACLDLEENKDTFLWNFEIGEKQNIASASITYEGFALHLEAVTNGQVGSQNLGSDQLQWGNMLWDFVKASDLDFSSMIQGGFCIQNAEDGTYLRVDKGILTYGKPDGPDEGYIWDIEDQGDGTKAIKNKRTSQYISMSSYDGTNFTLGCADLVVGDELLKWDFQISKEVTILSASSKYEGFGLYVERVSKGKARCKEIISVKDYPLLGMKWNFLPSGDVAEVAGPLMLEGGIYTLKNSYYGMYMIEDEGMAVYGNAKPTEKSAMWRIIYNSETGLSALKNEGTGHYLHVGKDSQGLVCDTSEIYYWNLKRNKNAQYPKAILFQDSEFADRYLHMESLNGFIEDSNAVQPTWGTPHWEPIKSDEGKAVSTDATDSFVIPTGFIRLHSSFSEEAYLYENSSGAVVYGSCEASDARSHWEFVESGISGAFYFKNRDSGRIITNKGNGTLRCLTEEEAKEEGSLWEISPGNGANSLLINNANSEVKPFLRPYLNIQKQTGFAQSNLVSIEEPTSQWDFEQALMETVSVADQETVAVPIEAFLDTKLYKVVYEEETLKNLYQLEYYGSSVRLREPSSHKYLYYDEGWQTKPLEAASDKTVQWALSSKAGATLLKSGDIKIKIEAVTSESVYDAARAYTVADQLTFAVFVDQVGAYQVTLDYTGSKTAIDLKVNGIAQGKIALPDKEGIELTLNKGINTITLSKGTGISALTVKQSINKSYRGASVTYTEYQAEDCTTNGAVLDEDRTYREISSEASGRLAVKLEGTGQYVKMTLTKPANAMVLRYCIPDSKDGNGLDETLNLYINGIKTKSIELTSKYSWVYGAYPWTNNPADGMAHHYFDETRIVLDQTYPAGTVIKLQKDAANHAEYYILDGAEMEELQEAYEMPENSLSIVDFGAIADDGQDDSKAVSNCIVAAVEKGKEVWIPKGVFEMKTPTSDYDAGDQQDKNRGIVLSKDNVVIRGAGMWHSVLSGAYAAFFIKASHIALYDFSLRGMATSRRDAIDPSAIETDYNTPSMKNLTVQNIWVEHYKTGIWTHNLDGLYVVGCRIRDTFADGMNLRRGTSNSVVEQTSVRNTGDDAIAQWSSDFSDTNNSIRFNTVELQWLANNIAVYGGTDIEVVDNILKDTVGMGAGVNISTNFKPEPFAGTITVARNTFIRCGSNDPNYKHDNGAIWFNTVKGGDNHAQIFVKDNLILDSTYQGISFMNGGTIDHVTLEGNVIDGCGSYGIDIAAGAKGVVKVKNNYIRNVMLDDINNGAEASFKITTEITEEVPKSVSTEKSPIVLIETVGSILLGVLLIVIIVYWKKRNITKKG